MAARLPRPSWLLYLRDLDPSSDGSQSKALIFPRLPVNLGEIYVRRQLAHNGSIIDLIASGEPSEPDIE